jgi:hypothetical protein
VALENVDTSSPLEVRNLILYHLLPLNFVTSVAETGQLPTLLDIPMDIVVNEQAVRVNGVLVQKQFHNILASNGVIHILMEDILTVPAGYTKAPSSAPSDAPEMPEPTIPDIGVADSPAPPTHEDILNPGVGLQPDFITNGPDSHTSLKATSQHRWHEFVVWITATSTFLAAWLV